MFYIIERRVGDLITITSLGREKFVWIHGVIELQFCLNIAQLKLSPLKTLKCHHSKLNVY